LRIGDAGVARGPDSSAEHAEKRSAHRAAQQYSSDEPDGPTCDDAFPGRDLMRLAELESTALGASDDGRIAHVHLAAAKLVEGSLGVGE
jgi:hypothetical protein